MNYRKLNSELHRDIGYFLSGLIFIYCLSGIALNHVDQWNPDFVIHKRTVLLKQVYTRAEITDARVAEFTAMIGEAPPKIYDFPTADQVKIYYDNATLHLNLAGRTGTYEKIERRPLFYHTNVLHRNTVKGWRWASDVFALLLIFITVSGWFILKGRNGFAGRGKWLIAAGVLPPVVALLVFNFLQK